MTRRRIKPTMRKLMLRRVADKVIEATPDQFELTEENISRLTQLAWAYWHTTQWADQYPNTVPAFVLEEGNLCVTFGEKPDEYEPGLWEDN